MNRLYDILNKLADLTVRTSTELTSSNWTASSASLTAGWHVKNGDVSLIVLNLKTTSALTAGTEYTLGILKNVDADPTAMFGVQVFGTCTTQADGQVRTVPTKNIASGAGVYVRLISI